MNPHYRHKHCYVFKIILKTKHSSTHEELLYHFLTDIDGIKHPKNKEWLEQGLRIAYGSFPKSIKFQYDKYT